MTDAAASLLRCPLDPARESPLVRQEQDLVCTCGTRFPMKKGVPIFLADQAEMPCKKTDQLPCRRKK